MKTRAPSVHTLTSRLAIDTAMALKARAIIKGETDPESFPAVADWVRQCYHRPSDHELQLAALNELLETHGVEAVFGGPNHVYPYLEYLNVGDPYMPTIILHRGVWSVGCYADYLEN